MSAQNAKDAADDFVARLRLTPANSGRSFQLVTFVTEEDCRFFYPRRALAFQQQMNTFISRAMRSRKVRARRIAITPAEYHAWRGEREDSPELRREFADQHLHPID